MSNAPETPQIYLISPAEFDLSTYPDLLARCLEATPVACMRLSLGSRDEDKIARAADALRDVTHAQDVALVIDSHVGLVDRLGLDGVHLMDAARSVGKMRKDLGDDAIIGSFCGNSRHDGMTAGELSADYVAFGPVRDTGLGGANPVEPELFEWWSKMIEVPVVAEGGLHAETITALAPFTDFFGLGDEIWTAEDPVDQLAQFYRLMQT